MSIAVIDDAIAALIDGSEAPARDAVVGHLQLSFDRRAFHSLISWIDEDGIRFAIVHSDKAMLLYREGRFESVAAYNPAIQQARDLTVFSRVIG